MYNLAHAAVTYLESAQIFILVLRRDETVEFINRKGCELLGYTKESIIGKNWFEHFIPRHSQATDKYNFARAFEKELLQEIYENCIWTKSGEQRTIAWHGSFVKDSAGSIQSILAAGDDITDKLIHKKFLRKQQQQQNQQILAAVVDAQEKERTEIAGELHGNVNQILTTCKLLLESEKSRQSSPAVLNNVYEYLQEAIDEIRNLSHRLDSTHIKHLGITSSIKSLIEKNRRCEQIPH